ncbi:TRAP transporter substrate-binding protein [Ramlibacter sp.]|uniref:TRAP transporter substrate-binding protein n=1 Tax=Ramlibacter sp. TaxID=1917967 RepID=UPI003D0F09CC
MQFWTRRLATSFAVLACAGILGAAPARAQAPAPIVMKVGTATLNDLQHEWYKRFAADLDKRTGGRVKVEIYPASQLGAIPRMIEGVQFGTIQAWNGPPQFLATIDSRFNVLSAPGVFRDHAHAHRALQDAQFSDAFLDLATAKGLKGIGLFVTGPTGFAMRTPTVKLNDIEGKKIRVIASDMDREQIKRIKASPVPMALGEVLPALQQGTIDGVMSVLPVLSALRYYDVAKWFYESNQAMVTIITVVSQTWLDKQPPEIRAAIAESGKQVSRDILQFALDDYAKSKSDWAKAGGTFTTINAADRSSLIKVTAPIGPEVVARHAQDKAIYDVLTAAAKRAEGAK